MKLVKSVYDMTAKFPPKKRYRLSQQMRPAAVSIPSNIAEGAGRNHARKYLQFLAIARGSLPELETQLQLAVILGLTYSDNAASELADHAGRLLTGLRKKWSWG